MLRATFAAALLSLMLLSGCSGQHTLNAEKLKSAATEIVSLAAEGSLLAQAAVEHHVGTNYAQGHPEYLRKQAEDVAKELAQGQPETGVKNQFDRLRSAATRLMQALDDLPATSGDPRWQQSRSRFDTIRRDAGEIRRTF